MLKYCKIVLSLMLAFGLWGCNTFDKQEPKRPSEMTPQERTEELETMLRGIGIELPENWEEMNKRERGQFLIQSGVVPPEAQEIFEE